MMKNKYLGMVVAACAFTERSATAACVSDWRASGGGDAYRSRWGCFQRMAPTAALAPGMGSPISDPFVRLPVGTVFWGLVAASPSSVVLQTSVLDLVDVDPSTGAVQWETYNASELGLRSGCGNSVDVPDLPTPSQEQVIGSPHRPTQLVAGSLDDIRGLLYIQESSRVRALSALTGELVWELSIDMSATEPLWQAVAGYGQQTLLRALDPQQAPPYLLLQLSVFSPLAGIVTTSWLMAVDLRLASVAWALPVNATQRAGCLWPPTRSTSGAMSTLYLTCDLTAAPGGSTGNTSVLALDLTASPPVWAWSFPLVAAFPNASLSRKVYFTSPLLVDAGPQAPPALLVGSSGPGQSGIARFELPVTGATPQPPTVFATPLHGWLDPLVVAASPSAAASAADKAARLASGGAIVAARTSDGALAAFDASSGDVVWALATGVPPPGPFAYNGRVDVSLLVVSHSPGSRGAVDAVTVAGPTLWWTWAVNGSSGLIGVDTGADGRAPALLYAGWPAESAAAAGVGGSPLVTYDTPTLLATNATSVRLLLMGSARLPFSLNATWRSTGAKRQRQRLGDVPTTALKTSTDRVAGGVSSVVVEWPVTSLGRVWGAPLLITNPINVSEAVLVYVGHDDDALRAVDPSTGQQLWVTATDTATLPSISPYTCAGHWAAEVLVCASWYGDVATYSLRSGALTTVLRLQSYWAEFLAGQYKPAAFPAYARQLVLVDDPRAPPPGVDPRVHAAPFSVALLITPVSPSVGVVALVRLPAPTAAAPQHKRVGTVVVDVPPTAAPAWIVWTAMSDITVNSTRGFNSVLVASSDSAVDDTGRLFVTRTNDDARAYHTADGTLVWSTRLQPQDGRVWGVNSLAYARMSDALVVGFVNRGWHQPSDGPRGAIAAADATTGALRWRTTTPCVLPYDGIAIDPATETSAFAVCDNAQSAGAPGKLAVLRMVDGTVTAWSGEATETMASGPSAFGRSGSNGGAVAVFGEAGGTLWGVNVSATDAAVAGSLTLTGAAPSTAWTTLNWNPAFTFTITADSDGVLYSAGGDDRAVYIARVPGLAGTGGGPSPPMPSPSAARQTPSPSATQSTGATGGGGGSKLSPAASAGIGVSVMAAAVVVIGAAWWRTRVQWKGATVRLGLGTDGELLSEAYETVGSHE